MDLLSRYEKLKDKVRVRKAEFLELMNFVEKETTYLTAPASIKYHLNKKQGLLEHSINVAETMLGLRSLLAPDISEESCVIVALMHDLGKAGVPGEPYYLLNEINSFNNNTNYQQRYTYRYNNEQTYLSVPIRSLYLCGARFPLTQEEAQAIVYHDGQYVDDNHSVATREEPLTLLLQYADNWSGFVIEKEEKYEGKYVKRASRKRK